MFKKLNKMKIGARLKKSFRQIILIFGILSALVVVIMLYTINNYGTILDNYAYPQGDIAMAMNESAEVRAASRGIVGYDSDSLIESMKEQHEQAVKSFEEYLEKIRPTMITKEGTACMDAIDKAWAEYKEVDAKVIEVGATTDTAKSLQAQQMMTDEAAPKYQALNDALQKLMALNISLGNAERAQLRTIMIAALTIIIIVIAVSTIYSNSLSVAISKSIAKNHAEEYVHLMGASDELEKKLNDAALFAFSSDWEGLPNALMEAMALGLPIVATDCPCGGPATLIENEKNGLLVPIKDADALATGMNRLIEDRDFAEKLGREARKIKDIANTEAVVRQWRDYIEELCKK